MSDHKSTVEPVAWMDVDGALHTTLESASFSRRPIRELCFRQGAQAEPVATIELVENKVYGGMHIVKWDNPGGLKEGFHKLYAEQPAPVAVVMPEHLDTRQMDGYQSPYDAGWNACLDEVKRLNK